MFSQFFFSQPCRRVVTGLAGFALGWSCRRLAPHPHPLQTAILMIGYGGVAKPRIWKLRTR